MHASTHTHSTAKAKHIQKMFLIRFTHCSHIYVYIFNHTHTQTHATQTAAAASDVTRVARRREKNSCGNNTELGKGTTACNIPSYRLVEHKRISYRLPFPFPLVCPERWQNVCLMYNNNHNTQQPHRNSNNNIIIIIPKICIKCDEWSMCALRDALFRVSLSLSHFSSLFGTSVGFAYCLLASVAARPLLRVYNFMISWLKFVFLVIILQLGNVHRWSIRISTVALPVFVAPTKCMTFSTLSMSAAFLSAPQL